MPIKFVVKFTTCLALAGMLSLVSAAQQTTPANSDSTSSKETQDSAQDKPQAAPQQPSDKNPSPQQPADAGKDKTQTQDNPTKGAPAGTSNDRLFFALPNFLTLENSGRVPPLTTKQKYAVVARGSFDPFIFAWYGFLSGIAQAQDSEPGYQQGWGAFGERYATTFADGTIENFLTGAILPSILREDPRYFQMGHGSFWHRAGYSISRNLITRTDSGKNDFNYSEVVGGALSAAISTYGYHPKGKYVPTMTPGVLKYIPSDRTLSNTAKVWGTQYAYDTLTLVVKEFWPDIRRAIRHKPKDSNGIPATGEYAQAEALVRPGSMRLHHPSWLERTISHQFRVESAERLGDVTIPADRLMCREDVRQVLGPHILPF